MITSVYTTENKLEKYKELSMALKTLTEGLDTIYFKSLNENLIENLGSLLKTFNEATMSDEDRRDTAILRQILSKAGEASMDKRRALKWSPRELEVAQKYNLTLPQKVTKWDGSKQIEPIKDNDVDYDKRVGRDREVRSLARDIEQSRGLRYRRDANIADFIRKRKEKGPAIDRPYRAADRYAGADDTDTFGDTTFTHDNSGRFGQDEWDKKYNKAPSLAGSRKRNVDLTDVEKDRIAINKQMSQPVKDMKAALADRKENQQDLDNVNLNYARNVADARRRFDDAMAYADEQRQKESERGRKGVEDANSKINSLLRRESFRYAIREKLVSLNEAEMSDEDKKDSEILRNIYRKTQQRANAALTPEEKAVLSKYDLFRDTGNKNIRATQDPKDPFYSPSLVQSREFDSFRSRRGGHADEINYADRARKIRERSRKEFDLRDRDMWGYETPSYEDEHRPKDQDWWQEDRKYQNRERRAENQKMTQNVRDMKRQLDDRKRASDRLSSADYVHQIELDRLKKEYEDKLATAQRMQQYRTDSDRRQLERSNQEINKLLKRESFKRK